MNPLLNRGENSSASKLLPAIFRFIFMFSSSTHGRQLSTYKVGETWPLASDGTGFESWPCRWLVEWPWANHFTSLWLTSPPLWKEHCMVPGCVLLRIKCMCKMLNIRPSGNYSSWLRDAALITLVSGWCRDGCEGGLLSSPWPLFAPALPSLPCFLAQPYCSCAC